MHPEAIGAYKTINGRTDKVICRVQLASRRIISLLRGSGKEAQRRLEPWRRTNAEKNGGQVGI